MLDYFNFSAGEVHLTNSEAAGAFIVMSDYTMDGFMALCQHHDWMKSRFSNGVDVVYPSFPYSRQDRDINGPFSLRVFANMVNAQGFHSISTWDPHSDVLPALVPGLRVTEQEHILSVAVPQDVQETYDVIVAPDAGAVKKAQKTADRLAKPLAFGVKRRDDEGTIVETNLYGDVKGQDVLIVDDICDGGATFCGLSEALHANGANSVDLYVTHAIMAKGVEPLVDAGVRHIYTTQSFPAVVGEDGFITRVGAYDS